MPVVCPYCGKSDSVALSPGTNVITYKCNHCGKYFSIESKTFQRLKTIQEAVEDTLKKNIDLRSLKYRKLIRQIVEDKLGREVPEGGIDRACRCVQNGNDGKFKPEPDDNRDELEVEHRDFYDKNN